MFQKSIDVAPEEIAAAVGFKRDRPFVDRKERPEAVRPQAAQRFV